MIASLQSNYGVKATEHYLLPKDLKSVILLDASSGQFWTHSEAMLRIAGELAWPVSSLYWFIYVPAIVRDSVYNFISSRRYQWFGKRDEQVRFSFT